MHGMIRAGSAVPGNGGGEFSGAGVEEENGAAFGGDDIEEHGKELPLECVDVPHGADRRADLEESREGARKTHCRRKSRKGFGFQAEEIVRLELLSGEAESDVVVELHGTALGCCCGFRKQEE